ncbi:barstar family protein [Streptomyces sp. URMC 126]|uniref:barstar family protein n=1 Tax=Streptomyces sp. URMC 126 TaxID=3423401 RepID=UPI003F1B2102
MTDASGEEHVLANCTDASGIFVTPSTPRERLTLIGFAPAGLPVDRTHPGNGDELGDLVIEASDGTRPVEWWGLNRATALSRETNAHDSSLTDITIEAEIDPDDSPDRASSITSIIGYDIFDESQNQIGSCLSVHGLNEERVPPRTPLILSGCEVTGRPIKPEKDSAHAPALWALDSSGRQMRRLDVFLDDAHVHPSNAHRGLVDIRLPYGLEAPPPGSVRPAWDLWEAGAPASRNEWSALSTECRREWLRFAYFNKAGADPVTQEAEYELDGRHVTDEPGLHCAMGEALVGPGGYYGSEWNSFEDCLSGGFGAVPPFTLIWHDSHVARRSLSGEGNAGESYFDDILRLLERHHVHVKTR